jgi:flavodoxin
MAKAIVLYNSKGGNTELVAKHIAEGLEADIGNNKKVPNLDAYDLIVVGSWMIMGKLSSPGKKILKKVTAKISTKKKVALFFTSGDPEVIHPFTEKTPEPKLQKDVMFEKMEEILSKNDKITIFEERFYCKGAIRIFGKITDGEGHPTPEKLNEAKNFGILLKKKL